MSEITYQELVPLLYSCRRIDDSVHCVFRCPKTDFEVTSSAFIARGDSFTDRMADRAVYSFSSNLRWTVYHKVRQMLGYSFLSNFASDLISGTIDEATPDQIVTASERERAVIEAFRQVQNQFRLGPDGWVSATVEEHYVPEFVQQLKRAPIKLRYDRFLLARLLAHIAASDHKFSAEEKMLIQTFAPPEFEDWESAPSAAELRELSAEVKPTVLMLAWALALSDSQLQSQELMTVMSTAGNLGLVAEQVSECKRWAQEYLVDQGFQRAYRERIADAETLRATRELGRRLGLDDERVERIEIRCQKRQGTFG